MVIYGTLCKKTFRMVESILSNHYGEYKYINLNWDSISGDVVEAGTPINANGEVANDNTAVGVMVDSCDRQ